MLDVRLPDFPYSIPIEVRFSDLDAMGHVNNAVYFTYFEQARIGYWLSLIGALAADLKAIGMIVVHAECDYASGAVLGEKLLVGCRVVSFGTSSFVLAYEIVSADKLGGDASARPVAHGTTIQVLYDWNERRTVPFTDELRRRIEAREGRALPSKS
jgi:acyl-CoA thioester hydrolase